MRVCGNRIIVGAPKRSEGGNSAQGAIYVYDRVGGSWTFAEKATLAPPGRSNSEITSVSTHATSSSVPRSWVGHSPFPVAAMLVRGPFRAGKGTSQGQAHASCTVSSPSSSIGTIRERS